MGDTASGSATIPDRELVERARSGDRLALADLAGRWADRLYNHCHYLRLGREDEARDLTVQSLATAARSLGQLREPGRFGGWLFAVAHREAQRMPPPWAPWQPGAAGAAEEQAAPGGLPAGVAADAQLRREVWRQGWRAAAALAQVDRELLNLSHREGFRPAELAMITGLDPALVREHLARAQAQLERALGTLLVAYLAGRADAPGAPCAELAALLDEQGWDGRFSGAIRQGVSRHADRCETCGARRRLLVTPELLLPPPVPLPWHLRDLLLSRVQLAASGVTVPPAVAPVAAARTRLRARPSTPRLHPPTPLPPPAPPTQAPPPAPAPPPASDLPRPLGAGRRVLRWLRGHAKAVVLALLLVLFVWLGGWLALHGQPRPFTPEGTGSPAGQPPAVTRTFRGTS